MKQLHLKSLLVYSFLIISINLQAQDLRTYPVLWHQTSAEYRALCYQAFNTARSYLETVLATRQPGEKFAIVTDLDETILDNSLPEAKGIKEDKPYDPAEWKKWVDLSAATAIPGA
ncbi:MAG: HAD family acid phosphatase, partial [Bacteroidales bacterium]